MLASDLQLDDSLPAAVAMLAIFQLIEVPASVLQLAGNFPASVVMLASDLQLAGNLPAAAAMLAIFSTC